jgi:hypothetical protein
VKILYVADKGANRRYLEKVLLNIDAEVDSILLRNYREFDQSSYDALIYQTHPEEHNPKKHNKAFVEQTDIKFHSFKGIKLLMDSSDEGDNDAFSRFNDKTIPRLKSIPSFSYLDRFETVFPLGNSGVAVDVEFDWKKRPIFAHCAFLTVGYKHNIRDRVYEILRDKFSHLVSFTRIPEQGYYAQFLSLKGNL